MVNNRRIWSVSYVENGREKQVQFYPNVTMFNHNFSAFDSGKTPIHTPILKIFPFQFLNATMRHSETIQPVTNH